MSSHWSRKAFFAKVGGLMAGLWMAPALFAKMGGRAAVAKPLIPSVAIRPEPRAVSRREDSC